MGKRDSERGQREWVAKAKPWRGDKWRKQEEGREKRVQKDGAVAPHIRDNAGKRRERKETGNDEKSVEKPRRTQRRTQKELSEHRTCDSQNAIFVFSLLPSCGELRDIPLYRALYALRREERGAKSLFAGLQRRVFALFSWARASPVALEVYTRLVGQSLCASRRSSYLHASISLRFLIHCFCPPASQRSGSSRCINLSVSVFRSTSAYHLGALFRCISLFSGEINAFV
ncbi:hypothetical protein TGMAS_413480 [Toxoplasma gondii MAS]|uniref:Uncharacterized protein n=1 Tax=Toxoplasma gondii MAS TaxID=943118 RepID=A0A086QUG1_TOXGO|nr:hypothetical protein TGMAS_413480 [Toxoplasma gondii MAS]